jgi:TetR/AcrR family transcriptional repressor of nem operon
MPRAARNPVETRKRLIEAAIRVVREKGYVATTVDDLCGAAGVSKGAFFHHFADKQALALGAAEEFAARADGLFESPQVSDPTDPRDRLLGYLALRKALLDGDLADVTCLFGTMVQEVWDTHPAIRDACALGIGAHAGRLVADIAAAKARHAPDVDWTPESLALHTQAVIQGAFILAKASGDTAVAVESLTHLERYLRLVLPQPGPEEERP